MDELELLARALPDAPPLSPDAVSRARARFVAKGARVRPATGRSRPRVWAWTLSAAVATATMVIAVTLVANLVSAPAQVLVQPRNNELLALADRVERLPQQRGAYWREVIITGTRFSAGGYDLFARQRRERTVPLDTAQRSILQASTPSAFPASAVDERAWRAAGAPTRIKLPCSKGGTPAECEQMRITDQLHVCEWHDGDDAKVGDRSVADLTLADLAAIPADRNGLLAKLRDYHRIWEGRGFKQPFADFVPLAGNLLSMPIRPQLRAAILRLLAELPGTKVYGTATDPLGRQALSVTFTRDTGQSQSVGSKSIPTHSRTYLDMETGAALAQTSWGGSRGDILTYYAAQAPGTGWTTNRPTPPKSCKAK
ncbi:hypothetical protein [Nonomuraea guangzhouensis]|uniref:CU044_5270 family protein n=1 Tax=Nonomuraea guangzhouensis TaxID=1291555 RepID=A0ABW4G870_9ACTN|nr:hypothetical protein [Nonomuraea guangzhouensis]